MSNYGMRGRPSERLADRWSKPRQHLDPSIRRKVYGPIQPMEEPGFFGRLFGWH